MAQPIIIDTDTGTDVDDALALALALASPELDLIGVTTVDANPDTRAKLVARFLGMAGRPDIPVYVGAGEPIGPGRMPTWFGHEGKGILDMDYDGPEATIHEMPAHEWLVEKAKETPYHLFAIGPFTNVALAVKHDPEFPKYVHGLSVMGGIAHIENYLPKWHQFFKDTGIHPAHMDHNTASDVEAALTVARAGFDMTWVTGELTFCTPLHKSAIIKFEETGTNLGKALANMMQIWNDEWFHFVPQFPDYPSPSPEDAVAYLHDPLTIASFYRDDHDWLTLRDHNLNFGIEGHLFRIHEVEGEGEATYPVSVDVDQEKFENFFIDRVVNFLNSLK